MRQLALLLCAAAEREVVQSHSLIQHRGMQLSQTIQLQESLQPTLGDVEGIMPFAGSSSSGATSQMMVLAMLLLMSLLCVLIDAVGRFVAHFMGIVFDDCEMASETSLRWGEEKELTAVAFVRLVGAMHLVLCSYGPAWCAGFNAWGASWFSFYFVLTGLGSAYVKLRKRQESSWLPQGANLLRHWALVYPLYLLALTWQLVNLRLIGSKEPVEFWSLLCELAMFQAFLPRRLLHHYNPPSCFFSALALCWLFENALCKLGARCWDSGRWGRRLTCLAILLWAALWPYAAPGRLVSLQDNIMALSYIHCYFSGVLLAHCLRDQQPAATASPISASGAMLVLCTVFCGFSDKATAITWAAFLLLPVQCLLVYGLGKGEDPLARAFSTWPLPRLSELALGIYIFQTPAKQMLDAVLGWQGSYSLSQTFVLLLILSLLAALGQLLQKFVAKVL